MRFKLIWKELDKPEEIIKADSFEELTGILRSVYGICRWVDIHYKDKWIGAAHTQYFDYWAWATKPSKIPPVFSEFFGLEQDLMNAYWPWSNPRNYRTHPRGGTDPYLEILEVYNLDLIRAKKN